MSDQLRPEEFPSLVATGLEMVDHRLRQSNGGQLYSSIKAQLHYLQQLVETNSKPTDEKLDSLTMGVYAAREFETSDPEFADVLFKVEYLAKRWCANGGQAPPATYRRPLPH
jgi:hypothetical protein